MKTWVNICLMAVALSVALSSAGCEDTPPVYINPPMFSRGDMVIVKVTQTKPTTIVEQLPDAIGIIRSVSRNENKWYYVVMSSNDDISYFESDLKLYRRAIWTPVPSIPEVSETHFP